MNKQRNVLITGADGQLGKELSIAFSMEEGLNVYALNRELLDVSSEKSIHDAFAYYSPDIVINCAAYTAVDLAEEEKEKAFSINANGPLLLAQEAQRIDAWVLHISTDYVFDGLAVTPYSESSSTGPTSVYGQSKLKGEQNLLQVSPNFCVVRTSWLYAATGQNFVRTMIRLGAVKERLNVVNDQVSSPTYTKHLANAIIELTLKGEQKAEFPSGIWHFSNSGETNWHAFAQKIMELTGSECEVLPVTTEEFGAKAPRPTYSKLDCSKIEKEYGIVAKSWEEGLTECLQEIKEIEDNNYAHG